MRLFLKTFNLVPGVPGFSWDLSFISCYSFPIFVVFCRHTGSAPITTGTHTGGGAVIGKPGSALIVNPMDRILVRCNFKK